MNRLAAEGTLSVEDGKLTMRATHPRTGRTKSYDIRVGIVRPAGQPLNSLDGRTARAQWNLTGDTIERVDVVVAEDGPILLERPWHFLNPYAFIPLPGRDKLPQVLHDGPPAGHDRFRRDLWTGTIPITITTVTPLLLPDHAQAAAANESTLPVRVDHKRRPILAGSAVKGMLRSAYEAITNSRLGVFDGHDTQLAVRQAATSDVAEHLKPAVVAERDLKAATATIRWVESLRPCWPEAPAGRMPQPGVWVPRTLLGRHSDRAAIDAWIYLARHSRGFLVWRAAAVAAPGQLPVSPPRPSLTPTLTQVGDRPVRVHGQLHRTKSTFPVGGTRKHDERLVVEKVLDAHLAEVTHGTATVDGAAIKAWQAVIDSYVAAHKNDQTTDGLGTYVTDPKSWRDLEKGRTLHAKVVGGEVVGMYPAMIGRLPFPGPPSASLPEAHRPATDRTQLSPADRVFGWVRQGVGDEGAAHRGHLRVLPPDEDGTPDATSVTHIETPVRLATLNAPKPSQFRFYLGGADGGPVEDGTARTPENGYPAEPDKRRLRGRKVYPTHAEVHAGVDGAEEYWTPASSASTTVTVGGQTRHREYLAPPGFKAAVTTSIGGWVRPGTTFGMVLQVDNLSRTELGALMWLLTLPAGAVFGLGLGKPLGFGAVRIDVDWDRARLFTGDELVDRYRSVGSTPRPTDIEEVKATGREFDELLRDGNLAEVRDAFLAAARGFVGIPVHYPRRGEPVATTYEWWVDNDRPASKRARGGRKLALGKLSEPPTLPLPYDPLQEEQADDRRRDPQRRGPGSGRSPTSGRGRRR